MRRTPPAAAPLALALSGAALLGGWWQSRPDEGFTTSPTPVPAVATSAGTGPPPAADPAAVPAADAPAVGRRDAAPVPPPAAPVPVRVRLPELGIDAPVDPVGVDAAGAVEVPADGDRVGWYRWSALPGEVGSTVLVGHVDTRAEGPGALFPLARTAPGALVEVVLDDGTTRAYAVVERRSHPKAELPAELFSRSGPPGLVLVTCGGDFDPRTRSYADNVVVRAAPR
ncbi:class F sortase [Kineococcus sp. SYSU DK006]|uniref:class F sortase n=1 Tax=Kineococcus sp. SYSU DK006 TaxID=3383127 RepID=UPI003D7ED32B